MTSSPRWLGWIMEDEMKMIEGRRTAATKPKHAAPAMQKRTVPGQGSALENPGGKWRLSVGPAETVMVAENAPLAQMVIQNHGPATVEVRCENEAVLLVPGKLWLMLAHGRISIASAEEATVALDFTPRQKAY
jgi:hypothetical protein